MSVESFLASAEAALQRPAFSLRERRRARAAMAPELSFGRQFGPAADHARPAAVLIAVFQRDGAWRTTLTLRPTTMKQHGGQICFPGGAVDLGESHWETAQREWREELGPVEGEWRRLGELSDIYVFVSNHLVRPYVAYLSEPPRYEPNPFEVERVLEIDLTELFDESIEGVGLAPRWGTRFRTPHFACREGTIWGATAVIIGELRLLLRPVVASDFA